MDSNKLMAVSYAKVGVKWEPPEGDFLVQIQPVFAQAINLCGYHLDFKKRKDPQSGEWVYPLYTLDSRDFPPRKQGAIVKIKNMESVLPEIISKLTNPLSPVVRVTNTEKIKPEEKPKSITKPKPAKDPKDELPKKPEEKPKPKPKG